MNETTNQYWNPDDETVHDLPGGRPETPAPGEPAPGEPAPGPARVDTSVAEEKITQYGWKKTGENQWVFPNGDTGYFLPNGKFVNETQGKYFDPETGGILDLPGTSPTRVDTSVAQSPTERVAEISDRSSPLMKRAETRANLESNSRGLLNSSLAVGAAQGAVLDRSLELALADTQAEYENFRLEIDQNRFESDVNYRDRVLEQEREIKDRQISLEEQRLQSGESLERERLDLQGELGRGGLGQDQQRIDLQGELGRGQLSLDEKKANWDKDFRTTAQGLDERRTSLQEEISRGQLTLEQARTEMAQENQAFYQSLDRDKFSTDHAYRYDVLEQDRKFREFDAGLSLKQHGLDIDRLKQADRQMVLSAVMGVEQYRAAAIAAIMSNPNMDQASRQAAIEAIDKHYKAMMGGIAQTYQLGDTLGNWEPTEPETVDIPADNPTTRRDRHQIADAEIRSGRRIADWGWQRNGDNEWVHPESGNTGYFRPDGTFVNETTNQYWDPDDETNVHDITSG